MRKPAVIIFGVIAVVGVVWVTRDSLKSAQRRHRQHQYEATLATISAEIKPGMTRSNIESAIRNKGMLPSHEPFGGPSFDDFIYIGQEHDLWYCNSENIDLQFHFTPSTQGNLERKSDDILS